MISPPHHSPTQQGLDSLRVHFDEVGRTITRATILEFKCTDNARDRFRDEVLTTFNAYYSAERDPELIQTAVALLAGFHITDEERIAIYDKLIQERPLAFHAALTVAPDTFGQPERLALFKGFSAVGPDMNARFGDATPV